MNKELKLINNVRNNVIEDEEMYEENCHCTDSGDFDIIASLQYGNKRYCIETTGNRCNVYLWEETCENEYWETLDCKNITGDQEEWKDIIDVNNYLFNLFGLTDYIIERR